MDSLLTGVEQRNGFDVAEITDEEFWQRAEEQVLEALHEYARQAANGEGYRRQLFADDAAQGFAFIDVCRKRFDIVLMNPPFGEPSKPTKSYVDRAYPNTKYDI